MTRVLVVDDEPQIVRALQINLKAQAVRSTRGRKRYGGAQGGRAVPA